ncbi:YIP1 family protein [Paracoccus sp. (in: a-proteobacteria)]|uniref:YIP1 family protein n=1 Tax=Paracoccus sp. TaxID=267 RepID=UPI00289F6CA5|nr:YIP1 family protein [Paracoccus sp. (in: a-proteobacteria)]
MNFKQIGDLAILTVKEPMLGLRALQSLDLPVAARWMALVLAVALSTLLAGVVRLLFPVPVENSVSRLIAQPALLASIQFTAMVGSALLMTWVGRLFGGKGQFEDALLITAWIEMMLVGVQAVQVVLMVVFPASAPIMSILAFGLFLYLTVMLTKALHGFQSAFLVILGFIGTMFVVGFALSFIAVSFGIMPEIVVQ